VRQVTGGIRGDDSRYERLRALTSWKPTYVTNNEVGPLGALLVNGGFPKFTWPETRAADPAVHAAAELSRLAVARGITVEGEPVNQNAPAEAVTLASIRSAPLSELVAVMVRESSNTAAELLVRELGRRATGTGTTAAGTQAVMDELAEMGLPTEGLRLSDGSGLEATNTVTCVLLAQTLRDFPAARKWLAVAGRSGTLVKRLDGTSLEGKLAGKTGTLRGVSGLVGVVDGKRPLRFAFIANGVFSDAKGRGAQDRLAALLYRYPDPD
jgi:D-alanyl-D-alanine carboxypeptidase/D-alanyl-D-alanine-endopeptidase (penicillin-binding protein 4)